MWHWGGKKPSHFAFLCNMYLVHYGVKAKIKTCGTCWQEPFCVTSFDVQRWKNTLLRFMHINDFARLFDLTLTCRCVTHSVCCDKKVQIYYFHKEPTETSASNKWHFSSESQCTEAYCCHATKIDQYQIITWNLACYNVIRIMEQLLEQLTHHL